MFCVAKFGLSEISVVSVPEPAISGNATGTILPEGVPGSSLKNSTPSTISKPTKKITIEPATAKDLISTPKKPRKPSPTNRKSIIKKPDASVAFPIWISPNRSFKPIKIGTAPSMSITAKSVKLTVNIWSMLNCKSMWKVSC